MKLVNRLGELIPYSYTRCVKSHVATYVVIKFSNEYLHKHFIGPRIFIYFKLYSPFNFNKKYTDIFIESKYLVRKYN